MKRVLLFGSTGMVGNGVYSVLKDKYHLVVPMRSPETAELLERAHGGTKEHEVVSFDAAHVYGDVLEKKGYPGEYFLNFLKNVGDVEYVVNALGVIIPHVGNDIGMTWFANSAWPHLLSRVFGRRLIHLTTDCVYNGKEGFPYTEMSPKTPSDLYGLSKSLGEPQEGLTLRTSVVGRELQGFYGLLEWFLHKEGETVLGFTQHRWNGITNKQFGKVCDIIMSKSEQFPSSGIAHIFSNSVSKYEMLLAFQKKFGWKGEIIPHETDTVNRELSTVKELNDLLLIPSFEEMVEEL